MLDLEQLRNSINEQDIPSSIGQVHQWIDTHGTTLLRSNQRLPLDHREAEEIRKQHEKVELKCMTFLAFYAKINLKDVPEEYAEMREDLDIMIQKFSSQIKARRHIVVTFVTFFRHLRELKEKLKDLKTEDLSDLPGSIEEIDSLIDKFHKDTNNCVKRLSHVKQEADRVKSSINSMLTLDDASRFDYVDRDRLEESRSHIDMLLEEMEDNVTKVFESQRLLELELKIESKMMVIEYDISRCSGWLQKIEERTVEMYKEKVVGMATVESDILQGEVEELIKRIKMTKEYGEKLMLLYEDLCLKFKRDSRRGRRSWDRLNELWALSYQISSEFLSRLAMASQLFHGLDTTLDKIENTLLSINVDRENGASDEDIIEKYQLTRDEVSREFLDLKQSANNLLRKLSYDLFNEKLQSTDEGFTAAEQMKDMVKMKSFTIAVKLKELNCFDFPNDTPVIVSQKATITKAEPSHPDLPDGDLRENLNKYLKYLKSTKLEWEAVPLPVTLGNAVNALSHHQDISNQSGSYWENIQAAFESMQFRSIEEIDLYQKLLSDAGQEKKKWDSKWRLYLDQTLNPRYQWLKKLQDFQRNLNESRSTLDDLVNQPNNNLALVRDLNNELTNMKCHVQNKEQIFKKLHKDALTIHAKDFQDQLSSVGDSLERYRDRLYIFFDLEDMIADILEFLRQRNLFTESWRNRLNSSQNDEIERNNLEIEAEKMVSCASEFDVDTLRRLSNLTYGDSTPVKWIIEELKKDFTIPSMSMIDEEQIVPTKNVRQALMNTPQGNLRNGVPLVVPSSSLNVLLKTSIGNVEPLFGNKIFVCRHDPLSLEFKLGGYRFAPTSELLHNDRSVYVNQRHSHWTRVASNRAIEFSHPAILDFDGGLYEVVIGDELVATTDVVVGDAPRVLRHLLFERVKLGNAVSIVIPMENIEYKENQMVLWKKDDKPLSLEVGKVTVGVNEDRDPVLQIRSMKSVNAGTYRCDISNEFGQAAAQVKLDIDDEATKETQNKRKAPMFVRTPEKRVTSDGVEPVLLKCKIMGHPFPTVKWTKDGQEVAPTTRVKIKNIGELHELSINNPRITDSGCYEVIANNSEGSERCQCTVTVSDLGRKVPTLTWGREENTDDQSDVDELPFGAIAPQFLTTFMDKVVEEGEDVILKCSLIGNPKPTVWWSLNAHLLKNPRFKIDKQLDECSLSMQNVKTEDCGRYSITAENGSGLATCSARLTVKKKGVN